MIISLEDMILLAIPASDKRRGYRWLGKVKPVAIGSKGQSQHILAIGWEGPSPRVGSASGKWSRWVRVGRMRSGMEKNEVHGYHITRISVSILGREGSVEEDGTKGMTIRGCEGALEPEDGRVVIKNQGAR